ncbi:MAG TPA: hypothetical protein VNQ14_07470 [Woeseiaceae bacterium]|nr:hypothetical protein [Woeseiaceae bacterium]
MIESSGQLCRLVAGQLKAGFKAMEPRGQPWPLRVETEGFSRGKTWPSLGDTDDPAPAAWRNRPKTSVAIQVDDRAIVSLIVERLSRT